VVAGTALAAAAWSLRPDAPADTATAARPREPVETVVPTAAKDNDGIETVLTTAPTAAGPAPAPAPAVVPAPAEKPRPTVQAAAPTPPKRTAEQAAEEVRRTECARLTRSGLFGGPSEADQNRARRLGCSG